MGFFGWRNKDDESLLSAIPEACALNPGSKNRSRRSMSKEDGSASDTSSEG